MLEIRMTKHWFLFLWTIVPIERIFKSQWNWTYFQRTELKVHLMLCKKCKIPLTEAVEIVGPFLMQWMSTVCVASWHEDALWRHQMETLSALLAICAENSPVPGEFPAQRPVKRRFDVFFDLRLNKGLSKQSRGWWFETLSRPVWRHRNAFGIDGPLWGGIHRSPVNFHHKGSVMRLSDIFRDVNMTKRYKKCRVVIGLRRHVVHVILL